ncbi:uncharacterized protein LOC141900174 [Tubulanus polymorphus]|uniref:uncharacterized protein LOC141900174 n=1 Tax=Tubulanus polymorphus TaxID=672921 RepID=UPI003DA3B87B
MTSFGEIPGLLSDHIMETDIGSEEILKQFYCPLEGTLLCHAGSTEDLTSIGKFSPESRYSKYPDLECASSSRGPEFLTSNVTTTYSSITEPVVNEVKNVTNSPSDILQTAQVLCEIPSAPTMVTTVPIMKPAVPLFIVSTPALLPAVSMALQNTLIVVNPSCNQSNHAFISSTDPVLPTVVSAPVIDKIVTEVSVAKKSMDTGNEDENIDDVLQYLNIPEKASPEVPTLPANNNITDNKTEKRNEAVEKRTTILFKCELCSSTFNRRSNYNRHRLVHKIKAKDDLPHKCDECGRTFLQRCDLKRHLLIHTNNQPYKCDICNKGYIRRKDLSVHMRFHKKEKSFPCKECDLSFYQAGDLNRHIRIKHDVTKWLKCGHCDKKCATESTLIRHMQVTHEDIICGVIKKKILKSNQQASEMISTQPNPIIIIKNNNPSPGMSSSDVRALGEPIENSMDSGTCSLDSQSTSRSVFSSTAAPIEQTTISTVGDINATPIITFSDPNISSHIYKVGASNHCIDNSQIITFATNVASTSGKLNDDILANDDTDIEGPPLDMFSGDAQESGIII